MISKTFKRRNTQMKAQKRLKDQPAFFINLPHEYISAVGVIKGMDFDYVVNGDSITLTPKKSE